MFSLALTFKPWLPRLQPTLLHHLCYVHIFHKLLGEGSFSELLAVIKSINKSWWFFSATSTCWQWAVNKCWLLIVCVSQHQVLFEKQDKIISMISETKYGTVAPIRGERSNCSSVFTDELQATVEKLEVSCQQPEIDLEYFKFDGASRGPVKTCLFLFFCCLSCVTVHVVFVIHKAKVL